MGNKIPSKYEDAVKAAQKARAGGRTFLSIAIAEDRGVIDGLRRVSQSGGTLEVDHYGLTIQYVESCGWRLVTITPSSVPIHTATQGFTHHNGIVAHFRVA